MRDMLRDMILFDNQSNGSKKAPFPIGIGGKTNKMERANLARRRVGIICIVIGHFRVLSPKSK